MELKLFRRTTVLDFATNPKSLNVSFILLETKPAEAPAGTDNEGVAPLAILAEIVYVLVGLSGNAPYPAIASEFAPNGPSRIVSKPLTFEMFKFIPRYALAS